MKTSTPSGKTSKASKSKASEDKEQQIQLAVAYARKHPTTPTTQIATLFNVSYHTLRRRILGLTTSRAEAHRDEQLFSPGDEQAIARHVGMMADCGFPLSHDMLARIAQDIVNTRKMPKVGYSSPSSRLDDNCITII